MLASGRETRGISYSALLLSLQAMSCGDVSKSRQSSCSAVSSLFAYLLLISFIELVKIKASLIFI